MPSKSQSAGFLNAEAVRARYGGVSHMWLVRKMRDEGFPQPVRFGGRLRFWRVGDVEAWERRMLAGDGGKKKRARAA